MVPPSALGDRAMQALPLPGNQNVFAPPAPAIVDLRGHHTPTPGQIDLQLHAGETIMLMSHCSSYVPYRLLSHVALHVTK